MNVEQLLPLCACLLPLGTPVLVGGAVLVGLRRGGHNREQATEQGRLLEQVGLRPTSGGWYLGTVGGRELAARAVRGARVSANAEAVSNVKLTVTLHAAIPLSITTFEQVPEAAHAVVNRLAQAMPNGTIGVGEWSGPGESPHPGRVMLQASHAAHPDLGALRAWLDQLVHVVAQLENS